MLLVALAVCVVLSVVSIVVFCTARNENVSFSFGIIGVLSIICCIGLIIACCCLTVDVKTEAVLDKKIEMYTNENARIEAQINEIVQHYMAYEGQAFREATSGKSAMALVTLFPELKSDTLVVKQMEVYSANNSKIKKLREEKVSLGTEKWVLYFGR